MNSHSEKSSTLKARVGGEIARARLSSATNDQPFPGKTALALVVAARQGTQRSKAQYGRASTTLRFSLTPYPVELKRNEWLRLVLASRTDLLRSDVSHGYEHFDMVVPPYFSRNRIHFGTKSYIELAQVGLDEASVC